MGGGCCRRGNSDEQNSRAIDKDLQDFRARLDNEVKLLLLGAGDSGKSTVVKQMKIIHQSGYTPAECAVFRDVVCNNVLVAIKAMCNALDRLNIDISKYPDVLPLIAKYSAIPTNGDSFTTQHAAEIKKLWESEPFQLAFAQSNRFQLQDSTGYYMTNLDRIGQPDYVPTTQDVLRTRVKTTGIVEIQFDYGGLHFRMFDVGGQRNERKKWIHCFQGVTALLFVVSLSEYDQSLYEDESQNRMKESLVLFDEICNSKWFEETSIILFFNKMDLFSDKIQKIDLNVCFPEYGGGKNEEKAKQFIKKKFCDLNHHREVKQVYAQFTSATDTKNMETVFEAVKDIILKNNLRNSGIF